MKLRVPTRIEILAVFVTASCYLLPIPILFLLPDQAEEIGHELLTLKETLGAGAIFAAVGLSLVPIVITPLSHGPAGIAVGVLWDPATATLITWAAKILGNLINFGIGWVAGPTILKRISTSEERHKLLQMTDRHRALIFAMYALPAIGGDAMSYALGAVKMKPARYLLVTAPAHLVPALTWTLVGYMGNNVSIGSAILVGSGIASATLLVWLALRRILG